MEKKWWIKNAHYYTYFLLISGLGYRPINFNWIWNTEFVQEMSSNSTSSNDSGLVWSVRTYNFRSRVEVQLQSLRQMSSGNNRFLDLFVGLHRCCRIPCCTEILRLETYSQAAFRWIQTLLNFRDSCCRISWWHVNNLAADGSGRQVLQIVVLNSARLLKLGTWSGIECCSYQSVVTIYDASLSLSDLGRDEYFHTMVLSEPMNFVVWKWHFPF